MTTKLDRAINTIKGFIGYEDELLNKKFDNLIDEVKKKNTTNLEAIIPIGKINEDTADIGRYECIDDYEVVTFKRVDSEYNEWDSEEDFKEHVQKQADEKFAKFSVKKEVEDEEFQVVDEKGGIYSDGHSDEEEALEAIAELKEEGKDVSHLTVKRDITYAIEILDDEGDVCEDDFETEEEAQKRIQELKQEFIEEEVEKFDDFEYRYDEPYWNQVYQYEGYVNEELAKEIGLGVLRFTRGEHEDEEFLFLRGCGMDLTPKFIAYQALEFGYIDEYYIGHLSTPQKRDYFKYVVGGGVYEQVLKALKIDEIVNKSA